MDSDHPCSPFKEEESEIVCQGLQLAPLVTKLLNQWLILTEFGVYALRNLLFNLICKIDIVESVRTEDLRGFVRCFVDTFLAVLEVETHVVVLETGLEDFLDSQTVFNLTDSCESARGEKLILWIVVKVDTG